jgi:AcrR family transcriptional regulator
VHRSTINEPAMCPRPANPRIREALLGAARAEFVRSGLGAARVEDITRRAGVSKGAFYLHFESKEEVFRQLLEQLFFELESLAQRFHEAELEFTRVHGPLSVRDVTRGTTRFRQALELECDRSTELLETLWQNRVLIAILDTVHGSSFRPMLVRFRRRMAEIVIRGSFGEQTICCLREDLDRGAVGDIVVGAFESFARRMLKMRRKPALRVWAWSLLVVTFQGGVAQFCPSLEDE